MYSGDGIKKNASDHGSSVDDVDEDNDDGYGKSNNCSLTQSTDESRSNSIFFPTNSSSSGINEKDYNAESDDELIPSFDALRMKNDDTEYNPDTRAIIVFEECRLLNDLDFFQYPIKCALCYQDFLTITELNEHKENFFHKFQFSSKQLLEDLKCAPKCFIYNKLNLSAKTCEENLLLKITITNPLIIFPFHLEHLYWIDQTSNQFVLFTDKVTALPILIERGSNYSVDVPIEMFNSNTTYKLIVHYDVFGTKYVNEYNFRVTSRPMFALKLNKLGYYFPNPTVRSLHQKDYKENAANEFNVEEKSLRNQISEYEIADKSCRLTSTNFYSMLKLMLQIEDEIESKSCLSHDQLTQRVKHVSGKRYSLKINNERLDNAVNEYTRIWITPMSLRLAALKSNKIIHQQNSNKNRRTYKWKTERIYGSIVEIKNEHIYFDLVDKLEKFTIKTEVEPIDETYFIRFMNDRTTITLEHRALDLVKMHQISKFFFPNIYDLINEPNATHSTMYTDQEIEWSSVDINDEQKSAVINILKQTSYPYPYILFGPPGTGKTKTLVEAITQIIRLNNSKEFILVCATSNSACDELVKRLVDIVPKESVFRMYSKSLEPKTANKMRTKTEEKMAAKLASIPPTVLAVSNLRDGTHYYPPLEILYRYKVVVCTLTAAGRLAQGKISPKHFSHIFIDESGSATESQTLIAIAGICSTKNTIHANIVFAGDPKQLGPVIKAQMAIKMGYDISMLDRLMQNDLYKRDLITNQYNANYVTQLIRNYRSHSTILQVSNDLFYENTLQVCAKQSHTDWYINSKLLKSPQFPFIFHSVKGITQKHAKETSPFNRTEIDVVISYVQKLINDTTMSISENDIGIISPYRKQCEVLTQKCSQNNWSKIQIGSVEIFQGQEKPIIIVSTVRSNMKSIGFLDSAKRLNVLLTRAKCLLIIIGDATTLASDKHWAYVINYCKNNESFINS